MKNPANLENVEKTCEKPESSRQTENFATNLENL